MQYVSYMAGRLHTTDMHSQQLELVVAWKIGMRLRSYEAHWHPGLMHRPNEQSGAALPSICLRKSLVHCNTQASTSDTLGGPINPIS